MSTNYDTFAERHNMAMVAYQRIHEAQYPKPELEIFSRDDRYVYAALIALVIASVIVSASHTIPTFIGDELTAVGFFVGLAAFTMVEVGVVSLTFIRTRKEYQANPDKQSNVMRWLNFGLALIFVIAVGANLYSSLKSKGITAAWMDWGVAILVGVSAPVMAFVSGEVLAMVGVESAMAQKRLDREHAAKMKEWNDYFNATWKNVRSKWVGSINISIDRDEPRQLSDMSASGQTDGRTTDGQRTTMPHGYGQGYTRRTDARSIVREHLEQNPDDLRLDVRSLADKLGVGKTTVAEVKRGFGESGG